MALPPETRVLPGHTDETTIGREWEENPFVRVWRGVEPEGDGARAASAASEATLVVWSPDYDGKGKAWVRFDDGRDAIVGGSRVERLKLGAVFPREIGAAVGNAVSADVIWASEGRSKATAERAASFTDVGSVEELVRGSETILSICPPAIAEETAERVVALGFDETYVEANAISPERMRRIAGLGPRIIDGSIIAARGINLYLAGPGSEEVAHLFAGSEVTAIPIGEQVGAASAL